MNEGMGNNMSTTVHARSARDTIIHREGLAGLFLLRTTAELLKDAIKADRAEIDRMKMELSLIKNSSLYASKRGPGFNFKSCDRRTKKTTGITEDLEQIHALARRSYLEARIRAIENTMSRFEEITEKIEHEQMQCARRARLSRFNQAGLDLTKILFTKEQNEWIDEVYTPDPYHRESLRVPTSGGILTRSNSEARIGSNLEAIGLPYRNDDLVEIIAGPGGARPYRDTYFADFKVPNLNGGITIHEHLGAFQIDGYSTNALKRLNDYHDFSVYELPGRRVEGNEFTWSFEGDLRNQEKIDQVIRRILLPGLSL